MRVIITGGSGFIGEAVVNQLLKLKDISVLNIDKLTYASIERPARFQFSPKYSDRYFFEHFDICNRQRLQETLLNFKPDTVLHLAAETHVDNSICNPDEFIQTNIIGTYTLLETVREYWSTLSEKHRTDFKFLSISTDEVFGDLADSSETAFTETSRYTPSSPYSASKASADHLVRAWRRTYGLPTIVTSCTNNFGPGQHPEKLIPKVISNALSGQPIPIYGSGDQCRDWLFVDDHAQGLLKILTKTDVENTYLFSGNTQKPNLEIVRESCTILDQLAPRQDQRSYLKLITHVPDRPGHDTQYAVDCSKTRQLLNWKPSSFQEKLFLTVDWYLKHFQHE